MDGNQQQFCFKHASGENIYLFTLKNANGTEVKITNYGAIITSYSYRQSNGKSNDIVLGFETVEEYLDPFYLTHYVYFGAAIGRYANRISNNSFTIDGKTYHVEGNSNGVHLHGGYEGFDKKAWEVAAFDPGQSSLTLKYISHDGDEGYPGTLTTFLHFHLDDAGNLSHEFTATTDQATAVNLTHHGYFNLDDGKGRIDDHILRINASHYMEQTSDLVVTGNLVPVEGTMHDFRTSRKINANWNEPQGFDQSFVIDNPGIGRCAAEAYSSESGLKLQLFTTEPIVHFYSGQGNPGVKGKRGNVYSAYTGFCFETQQTTNGINLPGQKTILRPGETYSHKTIYKLSEEAPREK